MVVSNELSGQLLPNTLNLSAILALILKSLIFDNTYSLFSIKNQGIGQRS